MKKGNFRYILIWAIMIVAVILILSTLISSLSGEQLTFSDVVEYFNNIGTDKTAVKKFELDTSNLLKFETTDGKTYSFRLQDRELFYDYCFSKVEEYNSSVEKDSDKVEYEFTQPKVQSGWVMFIPYILILVLIIFLWVSYRKAESRGKISTGSSSGGGGGGRISGFGKSRAKMASPDSSNKVMFSDVAGADEEKEELVEIVEFLKDPAKFTKLGAKIPHGVLLVGPPGTGKTLLARAVAGEAGVPFYSISGSDFVEMYVGVGASRVRDLFDVARKNPASIVFIDEIDAVGRHRGAGLGGGHDEREQTLNQLLVEMDGFSGNSGVIVMAATNRPDILDPALLRPGRFDRQVTVNYPDIKGREEILRIHARNKPLASDVNLNTVAKTTVGFTGADLANLLNEAALLAAKRGKALINMDDIEDATMKITVGTQKKSMKIKESEKRKTAYHEAGHAIVSYVLPTQDPVHQISIVPSGRALGYTLNLPQEDKYSVYRNELKENISMLLGGRAAERIIYDDFSGGASNDIERATNIAKKMVMKLGMSDELGPVVYGSDQGEVFLAREFSSTADYSEATAKKIDDEVRKIINDAYDVADKILREHIDKLHFIADYLVVHETIDENQFNAIMEGNPTAEDLEQMESDRVKRNRAENEEQERKNKERLEAERLADEEKARKAEEASRSSENGGTDDGENGGTDDSGNGGASDPSDTSDRSEDTGSSAAPGSSDDDAEPFDPFDMSDGNK